MKHILALFALLLMLTIDASHAVTVSLNPGIGSSSVGAFAYDGSGTTNGPSNQFPTVIPFSGGAIDNEGANSVTTSYTLGHDMFEFTLTHGRDANFNSVADSFSSGVYFSVDTNVAYLLEGMYTAVDASGRRVKQHLRLTDVTSATTLFENIQQSDATPNESFTLGLTGGDASNTLTGSATGTLIAGQEYQLFFDAFIQNQPTAGGSASASGFFRLSFIPEPSRAVLTLLGLCVVALRRRK